MILKEFLVHLGYQFGYTECAKIAYKIFQKALENGFVGHFLDFGYFEWCSKNPLNKICLITLSYLLGTIIGCYISSKRSELLAKASFYNWLVLNIVKHLFLHHFSDLIRELRRNNYSWQEIYYLLHGISPDSMRIFLEIMIEREKMYQRLRLSTMFEPKCLLDSMSRNNNNSGIFLNSPLNAEAQRAIEGLCIFDQIPSSSCDQIITEPEVKVQTYKFMVCKSNLFRSTPKVKPISVY